MNRASLYPFDTIPLFIQCVELLLVHLIYPKEFIKNETCKTRIAKIKEIQFRMHSISRILIEYVYVYNCNQQLAKCKLRKFQFKENEWYNISNWGETIVCDAIDVMNATEVKKGEKREQSFVFVRVIHSHPIAFADGLYKRYGLIKRNFLINYLIMLFLVAHTHIENNTLFARFSWYWFLLKNFLFYRKNISLLKKNRLIGI